MSQLCPMKSTVISVGPGMIDLALDSTVGLQPMIPAIPTADKITKKRISLPPHKFH